MKIKSVKRLEGSLQLPGDKSISHRAAMISALAKGEARIENFASSADCASTLSCLERLGVEIRREGPTVWVKGVGKAGFQTPTENLDCGNSGTTMRLLSGILASQNFDSVLIGDESLQKRPMKRVITPLSQMGAQIESENGCAPLKISGQHPLNAISYELPVASAQVKSCVLLAGLNASGQSVVRSPKSRIRAATSRNHTELMLKFLGANLEEKYLEAEDGFIEEITIDGNSELTAKDLNVPSDISSAAFFLVAASCLNGSDLTLKNVGLNPSRRGVVDVLQSFGASIEILNQAEVCNEIVGDLRVTGQERLVSKMETNKIEGDIVANLIDEIPILAVLGTQLENGLEVRDAEELRVKESDRIKSVVENLKLMQAEVEEFPDGFKVKKSALQGAKIDSYDDHRIAMAFAVAGLLAAGETEIIGAECVNISFPEFFQMLSSTAR